MKQAKDMANFRIVAFMIYCANSQKKITIDQFWPLPIDGVNNEPEMSEEEAAKHNAEMYKEILKNSQHIKGPRKVANRSHKPSII